jgi:hypothetical protein
VLGAPVVGGVVKLPFQIWSHKRGTWHSDAKLTSDQTPGTTIAGRVLKVKR